MRLPRPSLHRATLLGRLARRPLALVPRTAVLPVLAGPLRGQRWIVGAGPHGCWLGLYEREQQAAMARLVRPGDVVHDVGAHAGFYTLLAARLAGPAGRVIAFEPVPRNLARLREHLRLNRIANAEVVEAAVLDRPGAVRLAPGGPDDAMWRVAGDGPLAARAVALDDLLARGALPPPSVLKIDVEGAERRVLEGAATLLERHRPALLLSTHGDDLHRWCLARLAALGYEVSLLVEHPGDPCREVVAWQVAPPCEPHSPDGRG